MESLGFFVGKVADKCKIMHKGCTAGDKFVLIVVLPKIPQIPHRVFGQSIQIVLNIWDRSPQIPHSFFGQSTQIVLEIWDMFEKSPYSASVVRGT